MLDKAMSCTNNVEIMKLKEDRKSNFQNYFIDLELIVLGDLVIAALKEEIYTLIISILNN
jgi:hypothetical protein